MVTVHILMESVKALAHQLLCHLATARVDCFRIEKKEATTGEKRIRCILYLIQPLCKSQLTGVPQGNLVESGSTLVHTGVNWIIMVMKDNHEASYILQL